MDIGDILSSLSAEDIQSLKNVAASLSSGTPKAMATPNTENKSNTAETENVSDMNFGGVGLGDIAGMMSKLSTGGNDPRCQLITALKPMLSPEKQQRADEALRILKLLEMLPLLRDSGLLKGVLGQ